MLTAFLQRWKQIRSQESPVKNHSIIAALLTVGCKWLTYTLYWIITFTSIVLTILHKLVRINGRIASSKWRHCRIHIATQSHGTFVLRRALRLTNQTIRRCYAFWLCFWHIIRPITVKVTAQSAHFAMIFSCNSHSYNSPAVPLNR